MNEGIHLDLDTWIVPGQIRKANLCRGLGNRKGPWVSSLLLVLLSFNILLLLLHSTITTSQLYNCLFICDVVQTCYSYSLIPLAVTTPPLPPKAELSLHSLHSSLLPTPTGCGANNEYPGGNVHRTTPRTRTRAPPYQYAAVDCVPDRLSSFSSSCCE